MVSKGISFFKLHDYKQAKLFYNDALQYEPNNLDALIGLGYAQYHSKMYADAMKHARKAIKIDSRSHEGRELMNSLIEIARASKKAIM